MTLVGLTALSVDTKTNLFTSYLAQSIKFLVPIILFEIDSRIFSSTKGTCLYAAA